VMAGYASLVFRDTGKAKLFDTDANIRCVERGQPRVKLGQGRTIDGGQFATQSSLPNSAGSSEFHLLAGSRHSYTPSKSIVTPVHYKPRFFNNSRILPKQPWTPTRTIPILPSSTPPTSPPAASPPPPLNAQPSSTLLSRPPTHPTPLLWTAPHRLKHPTTHQRTKMMRHVRR
jgi:hypothetical protein